ncbi:Uncharacterised protein [Achromobacter xylosoxidans]|nr:Uncharacterised protein [Achromobacter xylosoxidans]
MGGRQQAAHRHRGRAPAGDHRANAVARHPELGHVQRGPQHHAAVPTKGRRRGTEPGGGRVSAAQPDPGRDPGRRHGAGGEPERRDLQRHQPGQRAQPGGGRRHHERRAVPRQWPVWRQWPADFPRRRRPHRGAGGRAPPDLDAGLLDHGRRLCAAAGQGGRQRRHDRYPGGPGTTGGRRQLRHQARAGDGGQSVVHHPGQRGDARGRDGPCRKHRPDPGRPGRRDIDRRRGGATRCAVVEHFGERPRHPALGRGGRGWPDHAGRRQRHGDPAGSGRRPGAGQPARWPARAPGRADRCAHGRGRQRPARPVPRGNPQRRHGRFRGGFHDAGHGRADRGPRRPAQPAARRRGAGRGRRGGRARRHGKQQHQNQRAGQRAARRPAQSRQRQAQQQRCVGGSARAGVGAGGNQRLCHRSLVHGGGATGSERLSRHAAARGRRMDGARRQCRVQWRRRGDARRFVHQSVRRHPGRAGRHDPPELVARRGRPLV